MKFSNSIHDHIKTDKYSVSKIYKLFKIE